MGNPVKTRANTDKGSHPQRSSADTPSLKLIVFLVFCFLFVVGIPGTIMVAG
eukprot:SAG31_NODE_6895_length_1858_cov_1.828880_2_plen_52_part_00